MIRAKKRADFEKHRHISDLSVIDLLLFKSRQDYQETMNCWKQEVSVSGIGKAGEQIEELGLGGWLGHHPRSRLQRPLVGMENVTLQIRSPS